MSDHREDCTCSVCWMRRATPDIFCVEESRKSADYFGLPWRMDKCREGEGEAVLWCVVHHSPIISPEYPQRSPQPVVRDSGEADR